MTLPTEPIRLRSLLMSYTACKPLKLPPPQYQTLVDQGILKDPQFSERVTLDQ